MSCTHSHTSDLQLISQNQQAFIDLLNEPLEQGGAAGTIGSQSVPGLAGNPAMSRMMGGVQGGMPMAGPPPGTMAIQVTPQEKEAIDRVRLQCLLNEKGVRKNSNAFCLSLSFGGQ